MIFPNATEHHQHIIVIGSAYPEDVGDIQRIADARLGPGYISAANLLADPRQTVFAAWRGHRLAGFLSASLSSLADIQRDMPALGALLAGQPESSGPIGFLHAVAVDKAHEKQGIGTELIAYAIDTFFLPNKASMAITTAWSDNQGVHVGGPLHRNGFRKIGYLADYWREDSLARGYECPTCGKPPCRCTASIFAKSLLVAPKC